ncbi:hypothetical protein GVN16_07185 [Emticicia sp. CRIBPO]|uniref:hypothetical protein n=1 Tax=Emticicia sp. CRIBPO TaxID=2683258 RepID=UPI0014124DC9|nr:hypothetical protein [Emticicia sp. CRIBPO]NBA85537.1 hypothetical protein [Emticicia sp. CRIBPO]
MIDLEISNYNGKYTHLNTERSQNVRPIDLARAMVQVGQGSWKDVFNLSKFRIGELVCKAFAFSNLERGNLILQNRFNKLNQSEKTTISYYFGQGLTKLYSEKFLKIKWLFHVDDYIDLIQFTNKGLSTSKITVGKTKKIANRPDLIGLERKNISHIFEAKGSSIKYDTSVMQHAINQVSQIKTYNGVSPETKTACYFDLSKKPIKGIIIDPENGDDGIDIQLDEELLIKRYYSFFLENRQYFSNSFRYKNLEFLITPVGMPSIYFGFDKRLLDMNVADLLSEKGLYYNTDTYLQNYSEDSEHVSLGLDGIILVDERKF